MKNFGQDASEFLNKLKPDFFLPKGIQFLLPNKSPVTRKITEQFFGKFFNDSKVRIFIIGINPGRFGAGATGIAFTDPIRLENECGIENSLPKKPELSSSFIYEIIDDFGGVNKFYKKFFLTSICPVGFTKDGKNINYYDDKELIISSGDFIAETFQRQVAIGANRKVAICLGEGKNYSYINKLNNELKIFDEILPVSHPRFIMQYRRKQLKEFRKRYSDVLSEAIQRAEAT